MFAAERRRPRPPTFGGARAGAIPRGRRRLSARPRRATLPAAGAEHAWSRRAPPIATNLIALYKALGGGWELRAGPAGRARQRRSIEMEERTNWGNYFSKPRAPETVEQPATGQAVGSRHGQEAVQDGHGSGSLAVVARRGRSRSSAYQYWSRRDEPRCRRGSRRATAGSRRSWSTSPPRKPLRVKEILVDEGDLVKPGQVLVQLDTVTLDAELAEAERQRRGRARRQLAVAKAAHRQAQERDRARQDRGRRARASSSQRAPARSASYDVRKTTLETTTAALAEAEAKLQTAKQEVEVARGERGDDPDPHRRRDAQVAGASAACSIAWPSRARCWAPGGKALTLVNLEDVYMEIFLPVGAGRRGEDRRRGADHRRLRARTASAAGYVSFVSPEAQFTPKQVETQERAREADVPRQDPGARRSSSATTSSTSRPACAASATSRSSESAVWPDWLQNNVVAAGRAARAQPDGLR